MKLLRTLILRPLARDPLRTALTILSVALGVGIVVAIDLASAAATGSFQSSMQALAGRTDLEIRANGGIDERWMAALTALPFDVKWSPVIEAQGDPPVYGVDLLGAPGAILSSALAQRLCVVGLPACALEWHQKFAISKILDSPAEFAAIDIATAQQILNRYGRLDRIDVAVGPTENFAAVEATIRRTLPPAYLIQKPGTRSEENQRMLGAFRWNLRVLSYISLVVGAFLIYNTISISVVRRRAEIGILRALGAARSAVLGLFLAEALILGIAGALVGIELGRLLASATVRLIAETVNALYTTSRPGPVELTAAEAWLGLAVGAVVALLSALAPAREAMAVPPTEAMSRGAREHRARLHWRRALAWSTVLAAAAITASQLDPWSGYPIGGYAAALLSIASAALAAPAVVIAVNRITRSLARRRVEGLLAARSLTGALSRTAVVVSALATAIAMMASVGIMVGSFRETVTAWLDIQLRADLYVGMPGRNSVDVHPVLPAEVPGVLKSTPGVAAVDVFHALEFRYCGERATLGAGDMDVVRRYGRLRFLPGEDRDAILRSLPDRDRAIVSEPFANKHRVRPGQTLMVAIGEREVPLTVAGIYYEYSSSQGYVILDRSTLLKYLPNQPATNAAVYLAPGADATQVQRAIQLRSAASGVAVAPNQFLRRNAIAIFDRTFAITWALEAVAIIIAMLGAANSLLALVLDRRRELGLLRYLGASAPQVRAMILAEAAFLGALALLLGLALGFAISLLLVYVVNKQSFGWTIQFHPPLGLLAGALFAVWAVTVMVAWYPARVAAKLNPLEAMHEE